MGLFDGIEKLLNEHGSATILKERIALANDKYSMLENKLFEAELRIRKLEFEKQSFELDNFKLKGRVAKLEEQLVEHHEQRLEEVKEKILLFLANNPEATKHQLAHGLGIGSEVAELHIEELESKQIIYGLYSMISDATYSLDQEGRSYLIKHGLFSNDSI
jgi:hypothetical protein